MTALENREGFRPGPARHGIRAWLSVLGQSMTSQLKQQHILSAVIPGCVVPAALCLATLLARRPNSLLSAEQIQLGCGVLALWSCAIWQTGLILREELWHGTLPGILTRRTGLGTVLLGKTIGTALRCALLIVLTIACVGLLTGAPLRIAHPGVFLLATAATFCSALVLGALLSCLFLLTPAAMRIAEALVYPMSILGGMIVPVDMLPVWLRFVPDVISLRWATQLLTAAAEGHPQSAVAWVLLVTTTGVYAALAWWSFRTVLHRARKRGTLALS
ncbi:ABC transporter permease [Streptomyces phyllanthi]|uniref:ABC transporter permease n=1 Tax=Streptomyces phyllanthi TaxID=1803180 RepID=A0A5N8VXD1_9ACTN|nr:ABC transporter permease [Streptomyces phyllanthi]MPY38595.1 ABC transporter permease [Streptomyces phyllanthi]